MEDSSSIRKTPRGSFSLSPEWKRRAEEELNESPESHDKELTALADMVKSDPSLTIPPDENFLLRFLRARKFDSKKAFHMLQRYYLMKLKCPELFLCALPSESAKVFALQAQNMLLKRDTDGRRVYLIKLENFDANIITIEEVFRTNVLALEHIVQEAETQIAGLVVMVDLAGLSLQHAKFFTPYYAKRMVELVQETFPLRFKGFHVVNEPFYFDAIMAVLKPFLKEKIRKRIHLHGTDMNSLHSHIPPDILPNEYGGVTGDFDNTQWYKILLENEEYFKEQLNYGYKTNQNEECD